MLTNLCLLAWLEHDVEPLIDGQVCNSTIKADFVILCSNGVVLCRLCQKTVMYRKRKYVGLLQYQTM